VEVDGVTIEIVCGIGCCGTAVAHEYVEAGGEGEAGTGFGAGLLVPACTATLMFEQLEN